MTELVKNPDVYGHVLFCDDIRSEVDGKVTYVGVYTARMRIHVPFPVLLPKFGIAVDVWQRKTVFEKDMTLQIRLPGDAADAPSIVTDLRSTPLGPNLDPEAPPCDDKNTCGLIAPPYK